MGLAFIFSTLNTSPENFAVFSGLYGNTRQNFAIGLQLLSIDIATRANTVWKQVLAEYEQPPLDPAIDEALVEYVDKRKRAVAAA